SKAGRPGFTVQIGDGTAARIHRGGRKRAPRRLCDGDSPRVRARALVAAPAAQPASLVDQGRTALPAEHGRDERTVPPRALTAGAGEADGWTLPSADHGRRSDTFSSPFTGATCDPALSRRRQR